MCSTIISRYFIHSSLNLNLKSTELRYLAHGYALILFNFSLFLCTFLRFITIQLYSLKINVANVVFDELYSQYNSSCLGTHIL